MTVGQTVERLRNSRALRVAARLGLVSRALFYLLLAYLTGALAAGARSRGSQVDANGALRAVAATPLGLVALAGAAIGFAAFGLMPSRGRLRRRVDRPVPSPHHRRAGVLLPRHGRDHGAVPARPSRDGVGPAAARDDGVVAAPAPRPCRAGRGGGRQPWSSAGGRPGSRCTAGSPTAWRPGPRAAPPAGRRAGSARSASWRVRGSRPPSAPSVVLAAVRVQPGAAKDLDQLLAGLNRSALGHALVWVIAAGFLVFAGYSVLESRIPEPSTPATEQPLWLAGRRRRVLMYDGKRARAVRRGPGCQGAA